MITKRAVRRILVMLCVISMLLGWGNTPINASFNASSSSSSAVSMFSSKESIGDLTETQRNSISMLNYLTVLTQEIIESSGSRLYLEEVYSNLLNNTYPNAVDVATQARLTDILDTLENYRMISEKRERLDYLYQQNQAKAMRSAVPSPVAIMNIVRSESWVKAAISVLFMAADSITSYNEYVEEAELQYLKDGWELDDEESAVLHNSRTEAFEYMNSMVNEYDLPGDYALSEATVKDFVKWKKDTNADRRIEFLESNEDTYQAYGPYWLTLAESYYEIYSYENCLSAVEQYENVSARIFRKDYDYAYVLPMAISSARELYDDAEYVGIAEKYAELILENTNNTDVNDWAIQYFTADVYMDLYRITGDQTFLENAYQIAVDNVNCLVKEQEELNEVYLNDITEAVAPENATKTQKRDVNQYNKMIRELRKTDLPPVSMPLCLNCELLFSLADELEKDEAERNRVDRILHQDGGNLFLTKELNETYWFEKRESAQDTRNLNLEIRDNGIVIPAALVANDAKIVVTVKIDGRKEQIEDWTVDKVDRPKKASYTDYLAHYTSSEWKKIDCPDGSKVKITVFAVPNVSDCRLSFNFEAHEVRILGKTIRTDFEREV